MSLTGLLYLLVFFGGTVVALRGKPLVGMMLYLQSFYFHAPGSWWGASLPDLRWSLLSSLITLAAIHIKESNESKVIGNALKGSSRPKFLELTEYRLFLMFVLWVWFQSLWAIDGRLHNEYAGMLTKFLLLLYLLHKVLVDEKSILVFIIANLVGCSYWGWLGLSHTSGRFESVPTPGVNDGNLLSLHMVPILLLSSFLLVSELGKKKYLLTVLIALTLNAIFLTQSRGGFLGILVGALIALLFRPYKLRKEIFVYILLALGAAVTLIPADMITRLNTTFGEEEGDPLEESAESRVVIIMAQWEMFKVSPIMGHGHRGTLRLSPYYIDDKWMTGTTSGDRVRSSHNLLMSLLVDFGLVGTSLYLGVVALFMLRLLKSRKSILNLEQGNVSLWYMAGCAALMALMCSSMFSNSLRLEIDILLIGTLSALYVLIQKGRDSDDSKKLTGKRL